MVPIRKTIMSGFDEERFFRVRDAVTASRPHVMGIGSLAEKSVHAILKNYYAPSGDDVEVAVNGFVADVCYDRRIIEIQTRQFYSMKRKLAAFLPDYDVDIVYPIPVTRVLIDVDPDSGNVLKKRRSPKKRSLYELLYEMYGIRDYLKNPRLHFKAVLYEAEEYRYIGKTEKHGRRKRTLTDMFPTRVLDEVCIDGTRDLMMFVPASLGDEFTCAQYAAAAAIPLELARYCVGLLSKARILTEVGKGPRGVKIFSPFEE